MREEKSLINLKNDELFLLPLTTREMMMLMHVVGSFNKLMSGEVDIKEVRLRTLSYHIHNIATEVDFDSIMDKLLKLTEHWEQG